MKIRTVCAEKSHADGDTQELIVVFRNFTTEPKRNVISNIVYKTFLKMSRNELNNLVVLGGTEENAHKRLSGKLKTVDWLGTKAQIRG